VYLEVQFQLQTVLARSHYIFLLFILIPIVACKAGYLYGRGDLSHKEVAILMGSSLRGEITPPEALSPPTFSGEYQRGLSMGKKFY
jgi:hypothetical protein